MEEAVGGRGFALSHQRVVLDVDFSGILTGTAYLTINPTSPSLRTLYLNASSHLQISNVTLSSPTSSQPLLPTPASYTLINPFQPLPTRDPPIDIRSHPEIKRRIWAALGEKDEGELAISVSGGWVRLVESEQGDGGSVSLAPIHVQIDYQLVVGGNVIEGIVFRRPGDGGNEFEVPHMFLSPTTYDAARVWTPCVDDLWERCTWELEFIVPRYLEGGEPSNDDGGNPVMVVASGELIEQIAHPNDPHKVIYYFLQANPTSVQHVSFAAGPFEMYQIPCETQKTLLAFCLPGSLNMLENTTSFLAKAMSFYTTEFGSYPFTAFKTVFVSNPRTQCSTTATLSICSSDLLHPPSVIDQAIESRQILSLAMIQQWVGINIIQKTLSDTWLINGLALYINSLFMRFLLGNNEYRFRLKQDIIRCVEQDKGEQWPLCVPGTVDPPDAPTTSFINLKAPLVLHILDRHLAKAGTTLGLSRVIPRVFLSSLSDEMVGNLLSTQSFFRTCRKVSAVDLTTFQDQWVYGSGCPHLRMQTTFVKKKFVVEMAVQQLQPAYQAMEAMSSKQKEAAAWKRPTQLFEGSLTVRIHEADGAPFEHLVDVKQNFKTFNLPFNTKYKRTRRSGRVAALYDRIQDDLAAAQANDEEDGLLTAERAEIFAYPPWDSEEERRKWRVAEWNPEQAEEMLGEGAGYEWIRVDPECEWIATFEFLEKPWYFISQLQGDRDVVAQLEAIHQISKDPSPVIASELAKAVLVKNYYYRVRMEAARALLAYNKSECDYIGLFYLLKVFETLYCNPPEEETLEPLAMTPKPRPNDFSDFSDYFLKKSIVGSLSGLGDRASRGLVWRNVRQLLLDLLRFNDNTHNQFSDSSYRATILAALSNAFALGPNLDTPSNGDRAIEQDQALLGEAVQAIEREITMDRLVPSHHNVVTQAGLQAKLKLVLAGKHVNDPKAFLSYTREGNFEPVRLVAFDCLLLCRPLGRNPPPLQIDSPQYKQYLADSYCNDRYLFNVIKNDISLNVRRHVARSLSESILVSLAVGDIKAAIPPPAIVDLNTETEQSKEQRKEAAQTAIVKAVRNGFRKQGQQRQLAEEAFLESFTESDMEIRFALLKLAEVVSSSTSEPAPGNLIVLSTPVVGTPSILTPRIRLSLGGGEIRTEADGYGFPSAAEQMADAPGNIRLVLNTNMGKKKKSKPVHKAMSNGLPETDYMGIQSVLRGLMQDKRSLFFRQAVDPIRDAAPDYLTIIKKPMDLGTAAAKLEGGMYTSRAEFHSDLQLIVSNALIYNNPMDIVGKAAKAFEVLINKSWTKMETTLENAANPPPPPVRAPPPAPERQATTMRFTLPAPAASSTPASSSLMPPPPIPPPAKAGTVKLKVKAPKSDLPSQEMPPPPLPIASTSKSGSSSTSRISPEKEKGKKRKDSVSGRGSALDDLLGAEVDAMEKESYGDALDKLLDEPKAKKTKGPIIKLTDRKPSFESGPSKPITVTSEPTRTEVKPTIKLNKKSSATPTTSSSSPAPQPKKAANPAPPPPPPVPAPSDAPLEIPWEPAVAPKPPSDLPPTTQNTLPIKTKRAKAVMAVLQKIPEAVWFLTPVDPVAAGLPTYFDEIKHPMDFSTIVKNLGKKSYRTMGQFASDVELVFDNCRRFNGAGEFADLATLVQKAFWKEWPKAVSTRMNSEEKEAMIALLRRALLAPTSLFFREPVDPVALNIPTYFEIIPQDDARDLSTILTKVQKGQLSTTKQVDDDVGLMLENAKVFNGVESEVSKAANAFGSWWKGQRGKMEI